MDTTFIKQTYTWSSGGGIDIDIVELHDGTVLGITEDSIVLYENIEQLEEGSDNNISKTIPR